MDVALRIALLLVLLVILVVGVVVGLAHIISALIADAPYVPTRSSVLRAIINELSLTDQSVVYDLGCGDARLLLEAVHLHPHIRAVGVEIGPVPYWLGKWRTRKHKNIQLLRKNIFSTDVSKATHIYLYLFPHVIKKLMPSILEQCAPGTIIASCDFEVAGREPFKVVELPNDGAKLSKRLLLYRV